MAYAAAMSVFNAIYDVLESPRISVTSSSREILQSAYDQASLQSTLALCSEVLTASDEETIINEARRLQDAVESTVSTQLLHQLENGSPTFFFLDLDDLEQDVDRFARMAKEMRGSIEELWEQKVAKVIEQHIMEICVPHNEEDDEGGDDNVSQSATEMVGLNDDFNKLREELSHPSLPHTPINLKDMVIWISGMAGVGKTAFAQRLYNDPLVKANFECCAFVRLGREYRRKQLLRSLHAQLNGKVMKEGDDFEDVRESLCETLRAKRFLIVLDDVWNNDSVEYLLDLLTNQRHFEGRDQDIQCLGKRILVTSRMQMNFFYSELGFKLRFMSEDESWELLKRKVFVEEGEVCPYELVEPGKKIAKKCGGLPLLINALAPILLREAEKNPESWSRVAEKPSSLLEEAALQISEVLYSSYIHLDEIYKLCFLYITAFPESYVVFCSTINNLGYAEGFNGFIQDDFFGGKSFSFNALLQNNVITDHEDSWSSFEIRSCKLHCAYWYLNKRVAKDNRFLYIMNGYEDGVDEVVKSHHRVAIQTNVLLAIDDVVENIASVSTLRSVLCTGPYHQYQVQIPCFEWKLLRVLDVVTIRFYEFPIAVVELVLLRYLALTCNANLPPSISKLWNLQYLIVRQHWRVKRAGVESFVPVEIWDLQELIHLEITGRNLPEPPHPYVVLPYLEKLLDVGVESCSTGVLGNIPNLKKLRIQIELAPDAAEYFIDFSEVISYQCMVVNPTLSRPPPPLFLPVVIGVKKLSLSGFGYPWEEMSKIAKLPFLNVLKLRSYAFRGEKWEVNEEMRFMNLQYLYTEDTDLVEWTVAVDGYIQLERITMRNCYRLHEVPQLCSSNYAKIELIDCNPLAENCAKEKHSSHEGVSVSATNSWKGKKLN